MKWTQNASKELIDAVNKWNGDEENGPQRVLVKLYGESPWQAISSLSRGKYYYHNKDTGKSSFKMPKELEGQKPTAEKRMLQKNAFAPRPNQWPKDMNKIDVICNSYQVNGRLLETPVYTYEVEFDPPIPQRNNTERTNVIYGMTHSQKISNRRTLEKVFGRYELDNTLFYSVKYPKPPPKVTLDNLHENYKVTFIFQQEESINSHNIPITRQEQLLNIFHRDQMRVARYKKIHKGWYKDTTDFTGQCEIVRSMTGNDLAILRGFEGNMKASNPDGVIFQCDLSHRLLWKDTLWSQLSKLKAACRSEEDYKEQAQRKFTGKYFILTYSRRSMKIAELDWSMDESSSMSEDNAMTFRNYFKTKYGIASDQHEDCVVKTRDGACFLPQHMRLTVVSDECKELYDQAIDKINCNIDVRMRKLDQFVAELNKCRGEAAKDNRVPGGGDGGGGGGGGDGGDGDDGGGEPLRLN